MGVTHCPERDMLQYTPLPVIGQQYLYVGRYARITAWHPDEAKRCVDTPATMTAYEIDDESRVLVHLAWGGENDPRVVAPLNEIRALPRR